MAKAENQSCANSSDTPGKECGNHGLNRVAKPDEPINHILLRAVFYHNMVLTKNGAANSFLTSYHFGSHR